MMNMLSGGGFTFAVAQRLDPAYFGLLTSPRNGRRPEAALEAGTRWAADNDCFIKYDPPAIINMLERYKGIPGCVYINSPDVIQRHAGTLALFKEWEPIIHAAGFPVSFTIHNGCTLDSVPFDHIEALFIGGNNHFKYSAEVRRIVARANALGVWVHNGRVNTPERIIYSKNIGCNSFDGTGFSIAPSNVLKMWQYHASGNNQPFLF